MTTEDGYPLDWPRCPACGRAALDGHITRGDAACDEGEQRRGHRVCPDTWRAFGTWAVDNENGKLLAAGIPPEDRYRVAQRIADDRGETVYLYLDGGDADEEAIEPGAAVTLGDLDVKLRGLGQPTVSLALRPTGYDLHVSAIGRGWIALRGPSLSYLFVLAIDYLARCEPLPEHASRYVLGCALEHEQASQSAEVVDVHGAASITGLAVPTLNTLRSRGGGPPFVKVRKRVLYRVSDLRAWRDQRVVSSTAELHEATDA